MLWQHAAISTQGQGKTNDALTQGLVACQLQALCQIRRQEAQLEDLQGTAQQVSRRAAQPLLLRSNGHLLQAATMVSSAATGH